MAKNDSAVRNPLFMRLHAMMIMIDMMMGVVGWLLRGLVFLLVLQNHHTIGTSSHDGCTLSKDLSPAMTAILCAVERSIWAISISSPAVSNSGCLLGSNR